MTYYKAKQLFRKRSKKMKFVKYWLSLVIVAILLLIGGYFVYPKTPFIIYDSQKYFGMPEDTTLIAKDGREIEMIKESSDVVVILIEDDDAVIKINFGENQFTLFVSKNSVTFDGLLEFEEQDVDPSLLKYANLAKAWHSHSLLMLENYSIIFYIPSSIVLLLSLFGLIRTIRNKEQKKNVKIPLLVSLSVIIAFTTVFNIMMIVNS